MSIKDFTNEKELLTKIADGDHHAFRILFDHYHNKIFSYSFRLLRIESLAEEIVQDVFINLWINRATSNKIENFGGYVRKVTRNYALSALRKTAREMAVYSLKNQDWAEAGLDTENDIIFRDTKKIFDQALDALPQQQQLIYKLCKINGMKQQEVAEQLQISPLTVKSHLKLANRSIRSYIRKHTELLMLIFFAAVNQVLRR